DTQHDIHGTDFIDTDFDVRCSGSRETRRFRFDLVNPSREGINAKDSVVRGAGIALQTGGRTRNRHFRTNNLSTFLISNFADNSTLRGLRKNFTHEQHNGEEQYSVQL